MPQSKRKLRYPFQPSPPDGIKGEKISDEIIAQTRKKIKKLMWEEVGIIRHGVGLNRTLQELEVWQRYFAQGQPASQVSLGVYFEVRSMLTAAMAVASSAVFRRESRGAHFREDFPAGNPEMAKSIYVKLDQGRLMVS